MFDPEPNPKRIAKVIVRLRIVELLLLPEAERTVAGSHRPIDDRAHSSKQTIIKLTLPALSARYPGAHLPMTLPALKIAMS